MILDRTKITLLLGALLLSLGLLACGQEPTLAPTDVPSPASGTPAVAVSPTPALDQPASSPTTPPTATKPPATAAPASQPTPASGVTLPPTLVPAATAAPVPTDVPAPVPSLLELRLPLESSSSEIDAVRIIGKTATDAAVEINGASLEVGADGSFQADVLLDLGDNTIEVTATRRSGETVSRSWAVSFSPPVDGLPFTVFYPPDGLEISEAVIPVIAGARPDAVVGVNGAPVEVNVLGLFSTSVTLDEGANLIEVVATDIDGNVRSEAVAVFYLP